MVGNMMGWRSLPRFPYFNEQGFGVYVGLLGFVLWIGRAHFKGLVRHLLRLSSLDDSREPMPYRLAVAGYISWIGVPDGIFLQSGDVPVGHSNLFCDLLPISDNGCEAPCRIGFFSTRFTLH